MSSEKSGRSNSGDIDAKIIAAKVVAHVHAQEPTDPRLRLEGPLLSRRTLASTVNIIGSCTETHVVVESVGSNHAKHVVDILKRETGTDKARHMAVTILTQVYSSPSSTVPAAKFVKTFITDQVEVASEPGCRWDDMFVSVVDGDKVLRPPVCRIKTFL
jgi:hypothetical protein